MANRVFQGVVYPVSYTHLIGAFCNLVDVPAHRLQFPDICFCVASVNDKNIPVYRLSLIHIFHTIYS